MKRRFENRTGHCLLNVWRLMVGLVAGLSLSTVLQTGVLVAPLLCASNALGSQRYIDCNSNGIDDPDDIRSGYSHDCNKNNIPDECDIETGLSPDCNSNGYPDECDYGKSYYDCDANGQVDVCEIQAGTAADCDSNGVPDVCDLLNWDCNTNGIPDACDLNLGLSPDCNSNGYPDECDVESIGEIQKFRAPDHMFQGLFGHVVDLDGDYAVVGSISAGRNGKAYIFKRDGGFWSHQTTLEPDWLEIDDANFGNAVAIKGDTVVVGAYNETYSNPISGQILEYSGAVYIYKRTVTGEGETWELQQRVVPDQAYSNDYFGFSVDIAEDLIVAGSYLYGTSDYGAFFVFEQTDDTWTQTRRVLSPGMAGKNFAFSLATDGYSVLVGAYEERPGIPVDAGVAYLYTVGDWDNPTIISPGTPVPYGMFSYSVAIEGDTAIIGTPGESGIVDVLRYDGTVYVFQRQGESWVQVQRLRHLGTHSIQRFGWDIALSGSNILVGAWGYKVNDYTYAGSAFLFQHDQEWTFTQRLEASDAFDGDYFGYALAMDEQSILIGAKREDYIDESPYIASKPQDDHGAVYYYQLPVADCNENHSPDSCDLRDAVSSDCDTNGIPDECLDGIISAMNTTLILRPDRSCYQPGDLVQIDVLLQDADVAIVGGQFELMFDTNMIDGISVSVADNSPFAEIIYPQGNSGASIREDVLLCAVGIEGGMTGAHSGVMVTFELQTSPLAEAYCIQGQDLLWFSNETEGGLPGSVETLLVDSCDRGYYVNDGPAWDEMPLAVSGHSPVTISSTICGTLYNVDQDADIDLDDYAALESCLTGPEAFASGTCQEPFDTDGDLDVDLQDYSLFQSVFTGTCE